MRVYRVENCDGRGPYTSGRDLREMTVSHNSNLAAYPVFYRDINIDYSEARKCHCGFISINQLLQWFDGFYTLLSNNGFKVTIWEVEEEFVKIGKKQLCFRKEQSVLVEIREFIDLM